MDTSNEEFFPLLPIAPIHLPLPNHFPSPGLALDQNY
jgi:hypothetical protein